nr:ribonuclease H-like domain-containing protein [Tanacetum cinerariifolium]
LLADSSTAEGLITQSVITHNVAYQADDLDTSDSDCDEISTAKAVLMANLSSYRSNVLFEDTYSFAQQDALILSMFEQLSNQVTNYNKVNDDNMISNETLSAELERYKERVKFLEERQNVDLGAHALCFVCNECLFDANHAMCLINHVNSINVRDTSKKNKKRKEWKPTGKVFNSIEYKWKPTGMTYTLIGNACPLTRITITYKVPLRVLIPLKVAAPKHVVTRVYTRRPKVPKSVPNSKTKVAKSMIAKRMEPDTSWGFDTLDHLCSACAMGKRKKQSHKPKSEDTNQEKLYLLYMDLCGPMRVASVNGKKYILVIVDDYSQFTWVKFLASKDEAPDFIINLEPAVHEMTPAIPSSGLVPNPPPSASFVPPSRHEWDLMFQQVFDELFSPSARVSFLVHVEEAPALVETTIHFLNNH